MEIFTGCVRSKGKKRKNPNKALLLTCLYGKPIALCTGLNAKEKELQKEGKKTQEDRTINPNPKGITLTNHLLHRLLLRSRRNRNRPLPLPCSHPHPPFHRLLQIKREKYQGVKPQTKKKSHTQKQKKTNGITAFSFVVV